MGLLLIILVSTSIFLLRNWQILLFVFVITVILIIMIPKVRLKIIPRMFSLLMVSLFIIIFNTIFYPSPDYSARFLNGLIAAEKIMTVSLAVFSFVFTNSMSEIINTLCFLPSKFRLSLTITFSIMPTILEEIKKIAVVQCAKGLNRRSLNPTKNIIPIIIPVMHRSMQRAEQIAITIQARGFEG